MIMQMRQEWAWSTDWVITGLSGGERQLRGAVSAGAAESFALGLQATGFRRDGLAGGRIFASYGKGSRTNRRSSRGGKLTQAQIEARAQQRSRGR